MKESDGTCVDILLHLLQKDVLSSGQTQQQIQQWTGVAAAVQVHTNHNDAGDLDMGQSKTREFLLLSQHARAETNNQDNPHATSQAFHQRKIGELGVDAQKGLLHA